MRDLSADGVVEPLSAWLRGKIGGGAAVAIHDAAEPSQGFSNMTVCFRATWTEHGAPRERALVARIQRDTGCPLLADIFQQWRVMEAVAAHSDVAVPPLVLAEPDPGVLGAPFFLMERVEGRVPPDMPSYHAQGWFAEALSADEREKAWWNAIGEMARLHQIDWRRFPFLSRGATQTPGPGFYLEHFIGRWYAWAAQGREFPFLEEAMRRLLRDQPATASAGLVWNDARMGNTMFAKDGLAVASLLDFDVATVGPAEIDLGWWLYAEDIFSLQFGVPRNPAIPAREAAIEGFERLYGRPMRNLDYYEALAALKHAVISIQTYGNGKVDETNGGVAFASERLARYMDRPVALS